MSPERTPDDFGSRLRLARERRGMSLRDIARRTKISTGALEALERNDIEKLPGGIFSRAFVRSYALEVGLDPEQMIHEFLNQFPQDTVTAGHPTASSVEDHEAVESERRMASTFLGLLAISVPLAGLVLYFGTVGRPAPAPAAPAAPSPAASPSTVAPGASVPETAGLPAATMEAPAAAPLAPAERQQQLPVTAADERPKQPAAAPPARQAPSAAPAASTAVANSGPESESHFIVVVTATRPCYVTATVDGEPAIDRLLQPGERRTIDVRREMVLTAGDAGALSMTIDGAQARPLGKTGDVVTARLTIANFKGFLAAQ